jgi:predicted DsbA family dithiol-disulfide isomerase
MTRLTLDSGAVEAILWSDYLCPWCYVGLDRSALLRDLGVDVTALPFELHPRLPVGGVSLRERWGARYDEATDMYRRIEAECDAVGLPFRRPQRVPNTRRALETAEHVRRTTPAAFHALDRALFDAHFVHQDDIGDADVLDQLVADAGADATAVRSAVDGGETRAALVESMERARELEVTATPSWLLDQALVLPGVLPRELFERAVTRLRNR